MNEGRKEEGSSSARAQEEEELRKVRRGLFRIKQENEEMKSERDLPRHGEKLKTKE